MVLFGLYVLDKDFSMVLKILPVSYGVYITALFINSIPKPRKTRAKKVLYLSYLLLSVAIVSFCTKKVAQIIYGQVMYFIVYEQCQQTCKFTSCDEADEATEQVPWTDFEYEDILSSCVAQKDLRSKEKAFVDWTFVLMIPFQIYFTFVVYQTWMESRRLDRLELLMRVEKLES